MSWRSRLLPASYRGVPFEVETHDKTGGRRGVLHEYPRRDEPYWEDLGHKAHRYSVVGFIVGDNYDLLRRALEIALDSEGPGLLVHPYIGPMQVACIDYAVTESVFEGRVARFAMTFVPAGSPVFPLIGTDLAGKVADAADGLLSVAGDAFGALYTVAGLPGFVFDSVADGVTDLVETVVGLDGAFDVVEAGADLIADLGATVYDAAGLAEGVTGLVGTLATTVADRGSSIVSGVVSEAAEHLSGASAVVGMMRRVGAFDLSSTIGGIAQSTATRVAQVGNLSALQSLVRRSAIAEEARALMDVSFDSYDAAMTAMRGLTDRIDAEIRA